MPSPHNQWEVTYVNHVPRGVLWNAPSDWPDVFPGLVGRWTDSESKFKPESLTGACRFEIPPRRGRVHAQFQHGKMANNEEVLVLNLTARGPLIPGETGWDLESCMKIGHDALVRIFVELSSRSALDHWERI